MNEIVSLHEFLDCHYGENGDAELTQRLATETDIDMQGSDGETPLHVATRRRRLGAVKILIDRGANINALDGFGKSAFAHSARRSFGEVSRFLAERGADTTLNSADQFAVAVVEGNMDEARSILAADPVVAKTGNASEDRLLPDVAGRSPIEPVKLLIDAGADLTAVALDNGTALHQAAWFGQPANARLLIDAGAPLDWFETSHGTSPLHWAVHGGRYSGGAGERQNEYVALVEMLLSAGSSLYYPDRPNDDEYKFRLLNDATPTIRPLLEAAIAAEAKN